MKPHNGFSLIEMAVALVIIGLLLGNFLVPLSAQLNMQNIKRTDNALEEIKEALLGFALINLRLPCAAPDQELDLNGDSIPEANKGREHQDWCDREGYLPWKDLGVGRYDGWGNPFRYRGDRNYTGGIPNSLNTSNRFRVQNKQAINLTSTETNNTSRLVAIIFSYGKNNRAESENDDADRTYIQDVYVENQNNPGNTFDDRLTWLSKYTLMTRLIAAKQWSP